ncbi:aromatic ring-hydroxylating dioxygenase subunit alpha [Henriciella aquimarina]|uniref:aromatic ring-hydroxylating dioxygenase subunit alpha n=1 Tax=Henriciella aquimarina TaxID=545261 RepID=UPI000A060954|nr:aromatic ring-hydroxylating dioxygenase subunit alpha [Henriciella aquimarina]
MTSQMRKWPGEPGGKVPYWVYTDPDVYKQELEKIWYGPHWLYAGLACEVPNVGDFKTTILGERPVIMVRSDEDTISVVENRCAHRGVKFCQERFGNKADLLCPYHQWVYDLKGDLMGVPFRRGVRKQGGMPKDFDPSQHGLNKLKVEEVNGVVWASFSDETPPFREYLGEKFWKHYTRVYDGRPLEVLGYNRQRIPGNWKLMQENIKDPYHASLLHVFFVTFGLFRADQKSAVDIDETGRHGILISRKGDKEKNDVTGDMRNFQGDLDLQDPRILDVVQEFPGEETVGMITIFPSVILQQQVNSLTTRQIVPTGAGSFDFHWTHWTYADDTEEMKTRRTRQANLFGPAGFVSADDGEVIEFGQQGFEGSEDEAALTTMGGYDSEPTDHMVTEAAIRGMYSYWRKVMGYDDHG